MWDAGHPTEILAAILPRGLQTWTENLCPWSSSAAVCCLRSMPTDSGTKVCGGCLCERSLPRVSRDLADGDWITEVFLNSVCGALEEAREKNARASEELASQARRMLFSQQNVCLLLFSESKQRPEGTETIPCYRPLFARGHTEMFCFFFVDRHRGVQQEGWASCTTVLLHPLVFQAAFMLHVC